MKASRVAVVMVMVAVLAGCSSLSNRFSNVNNGLAHRSVAERMADANMEREIKARLSALPELVGQNGRVMADVFQGYVLLTGEVPDERTHSAVIDAVNSTQVRGGKNHLLVGPVKLRSQTLHEKYLKTKLLRDMKMHGMDTSRYKVVVHQDKVYLMGNNLAQNEVLMVYELQKRLGISDIVPISVSPASVTNTPYAQPTTQPPVYQPTTNNTGYPSTTNNAGYPANYGYTNQPNYGYTNQSNGAYQPNKSNVNLVKRPSVYDPPTSPKTGYVQKWEHPTKAP